MLSAFDLNGVWASGGEAGPLIVTQTSLPPGSQPDPDGNFFTVDMSAYREQGGITDIISDVRPIAYGTIHDATHIDIIFPDDKDYTAELIPGNASTGVRDTILFSNNSSWTRVVNFWGGATLIPLEGRWSYNGAPGPFIGPPDASGLNFPIDMSFQNRPAAKLLRVTTLENIPTFASVVAVFEDPQSEVYAILKPSPRSIAWYNNSVWTWVAPSFTASWKSSSDGPTLVVTGANYPGNRSLIVSITSPDQPTVHIQEDVMTSALGAFILSVQEEWRSGDRLTITVQVQTGPSPFASTVQAVAEGTAQLVKT